MSLERSTPIKIEKIITYSQNNTFHGKYITITSMGTNGLITLVKEAESSCSAERTTKYDAFSL